MLALAERPAGRWADLSKRVLSALVLAPIALVCVWLGGAAFAVIVAAVMLGLAVEWLGLCRAVRRGALLRPAGLAYVARGGRGAACGCAMTPSRAAPMCCFCCSSSGPATSAPIWSGAGSAARGWPRTSRPARPGRARLGGLLAAVAAGLVAAHVLSGLPPTWRGVVIAAALGIVAQAGDLLESFVKRRLAVKDSGHLIPGHGGLFDRLDGVLAAAPVAAVLALTLGRGVVLWQ